MLISDHYRSLNAQLHKTNPGYGGGSSEKFGHHLVDLVKTYGEDVLDYGCGKGSLMLNYPYVKGYDPCIEAFSALPEPADLVICRDVMEHVEPECVDEVLDHIKSLTKKAAYFVIACRLATKLLPDGRNTHQSVHPPDWWLKKLGERFTVKNHHVKTEELWCLCE